MITLKVLAISASKKSVLCSAGKKVGIFMSEVTGSIRIADGEEVPEVGTEYKLESVNKATLRTSVTEDGVVFNWLILE